MDLMDPLEQYRCDCNSNNLSPYDIKTGKKYEKAFGDLEQIIAKNNSEKRKYITILNNLKHQQKNDTEYIDTIGVNLKKKFTKVKPGIPSCLLKSPESVNGTITSIAETYFDYELNDNEVELNANSNLSSKKYCDKCEPINNNVSDIVSFVLRENADTTDSLINHEFLKNLTPYLDKYHNIPRFRIAFVKLWNHCHKDIIKNQNLIREDMLLNQNYLADIVTRIISEISTWEFLPGSENILVLNEDYKELLEFCKASTETFYKFSTYMGKIIMTEHKEDREYLNYEQLLSQILNDLERLLGKNDFFKLYPFHLRFLIVFYRTACNLADNLVIEFLRVLREKLSCNDYNVVVTHNYNSIKIFLK